MVFSSLIFLILFLVAFLICYFPVGALIGRILPSKSAQTGVAIRNAVLLIFSLLFYSWGEPRCVFLMILSSLVDYVDGLLLEKFEDRPGIRKLCLILSLVINFSILGVMKYADFFVGTLNLIPGVSIPLPGITLPIGISFYTFQTTSYSIDVYRKNVRAEKNYFRYLTYISMFSQLIAGPIVRYSRVSKELRERTSNTENFTKGFYRFLIGLFRKVLIANELGALWDSLRGFENLSVLGAWFGMLVFTLQLYYDFSAYSDMAIGLGRMMGFHFDENFHYPLSATSLTDFWRRWHISLSGWFRDYLYIPLGGNRNGKWKELRNLFIVWFLTGLWHGASWNFVLWGLYHGLFLVLEKFVYGRFLEKIPKIFRYLYTLIIVMFGFGLFYFDRLPDFGHYLGYALKLAGNAFAGPELLWSVANYLPVLLFALIMMFPVFPKMLDLYRKLNDGKKTAIYTVGGFCAAALLLLCIANLVGDSFNPFLYFRF